MHEESIRWPDGNIMALSVVVNVEEGSEMTVARGDRGMEPVDELGIHIRSPIRNYGNESNYRYGIKAGAPRIVRLLKDYDIMASWTVAALSLENHPEIATAIAELGHELLALIGAGLIIGSTIYIAQREARLGRLPAKSPDT